MKASAVLPACRPSLLLQGPGSHLDPGRAWMLDEVPGKRGRDSTAHLWFLKNWKIYLQSCLLAVWRNGRRIHFFWVLLHSPHSLGEDWGIMKENEYSQKWQSFFILHT